MIFAFQTHLKLPLVVNPFTYDQASKKLLIGSHLNLMIYQIKITIFNCLAQFINIGSRNVLRQQIFLQFVNQQLYKMQFGVKGLRNKNTFFS